MNLGFFSAFSIVISLIIGTLSAPAVAPATLSSDNVAPAELARCLTAGQARVYTAYWCPHCADQKEMFGDSLSSVDVIECDPQGENADPEACKDAGIESLPTWQMPGKEDLVGAHSLSQLAEWSGCKN